MSFHAWQSTIFRSPIPEILPTWWWVWEPDDRTSRKLWRRRTGYQWLSQWGSFVKAESLQKSCSVAMESQLHFFDFWWPPCMSAQQSLRDRWYIDWFWIVNLLFGIIHRQTSTVSSILYIVLLLAHPSKGFHHGHFFDIHRALSCWTSTQTDLSAVCQEDFKRLEENGGKLCTHPASRHFLPTRLPRRSRDFAPKKC